MSMITPMPAPIATVTPTLMTTVITMRITPHTTTVLPPIAAPRATATRNIAMDTVHIITTTPARCGPSSIRASVAAATCM